MNRKLKLILVILYICLIIVLAVATFVEQVQGTDFVTRYIYHSIPFVCLWFGLALLAAIVFIRQKLWRQLPTFLLHVSFLVILSGAMSTFLWGKKGYLHLSVGQESNRYIEQKSGLPQELPFTLQLDSFRIAYYPGTEAPVDYISYIHQAPPISMNRIMEREGYRFYQSSYDEDGKGTWLSVNYDPWGITLTYTGYLMLGISMLWVLFSKKGTFRKLLNHPLLRKSTVCALLLMGSSLQAANYRLSDLSPQQTDSMARTQVIYHDRVAPFNTLARDFVLKLTGKPTYAGLSPEQIVDGWLRHPNVWKEEPMIRIKNKDLCKLLGLDSPYARFSQLFEEEKYRLETIYKQIKPSFEKPTALEKALVELDEKVGLTLMLQNGSLIRPLSENPDVTPLSETKIEAELLYNKIPFSKILFMFCLTMGGFSFLQLLYGRKRYNIYFAGALYLALLFHTWGYGLRWYIGGRIPLSNGYETMQFLALCTLVVACLLRKRFPFTTAFGFLLAGFTLLVSYLGQMNPQITPLMPVLISPWLSAHVSLIMMSYALFAFIMLNGVLALCRPAEAESLRLFSKLMLYPATFFLGAGIFMGAVWANVSWGRYWAWDPKEVWALITFLVYSLAFHDKSLRWLCCPKVFHIYMITAFLTVLMTYFGVNYILGGLHSYANG
ncbi:MAG: cytochrome c biogenesis protein CcsA [Bacteroides sp.]|nr:cytochrome c biogenesis protein CcsA [Bacteroides sp.]